MDDRIWQTMPNSKVFRRKKSDEKKDEKKEGDRNDRGINDNFKNNRERDNLKQNIIDLITLHCKQEDANNINYEKLFQGDMPPKAKELEDFVNKFKDKDTSKDKDIEKYKKNAREKLNRVKNLVPENKSQIKALRLDDEPNDMNDRRNKQYSKVMAMGI